jgi:hypothetical protein
MYHQSISPLFVQMQEYRAEYNHLMDGYSKLSEEYYAIFEELESRRSLAQQNTHQTGYREQVGEKEKQLNEADKFEELQNIVKLRKPDKQTLEKSKTARAQQLARFGKLNE